MRPSTYKALALGAIGASVLIGIPAVACTPAKANPSTITEDSPDWDCTTMGNQVCGPRNPQGAHPGQYVAGNLVISWPVVKRCHTIPATGFQWCVSEAAQAMDGNCYNNAGQLVAVKPCYFAVNDLTGEADIYQGVGAR